MKKFILGLLVCLSSIFADEVENWLKVVNMFKMAVEEAPYKLNDKKCEALEAFVFMKENQIFASEINKLYSRYGIDADKAYNLLNIIEIDMASVLGECKMILAGQLPPRWKDLPKNFKHKPLFKRADVFKTAKEYKLERLEGEVRFDFDKYTGWVEIIGKPVVWSACKKAKKATEETLALRDRVLKGEFEKYKGIEKEAVEEIDRRLKKYQGYTIEDNGCKF